MPAKPLRPPAAAGDQTSLRGICEAFAKEYEKTALRIKILDLWATCSLAMALLQCLYAAAVGSFPFNAFLAGFFCCLGSAVLTLALRLQLTLGAAEGVAKPPERAFAEYSLAVCALLLAVWNLIG